MSTLSCFTELGEAICHNLFPLLRVVENRRLTFGLVQSSRPADWHQLSGFGRSNPDSAWIIDSSDS
jgi:hypothetical protein